MKFVYYTVVIPYTLQHRTEWHPTEGTTLTRGAFDTHEEAMMWARTHLGPTEWSIRRDDSYLRAHLAHFRKSVRHGRRSTEYVWRKYNRRRATAWFKHLQRRFGRNAVYVVG
jgi:hypothetical protein